MSFKQGTHEPVMPLSLLGTIDERISFLHLFSSMLAAINGILIFQRPTPSSSGNQPPITETPVTEDNPLLLFEAIVAAAIFGLSLVSIIALFPKQAWKKNERGAWDWLLFNNNYHRAATLLLFALAITLPTLSLSIHDKDDKKTLRLVTSLFPSALYLLRLGLFYSRIGLSLEQEYECLILAVFKDITIKKYDDLETDNKQKNLISTEIFHRGVFNKDLIRVLSDLFSNNEKFCLQDDLALAKALLFHVHATDLKNLIAILNYRPPSTAFYQWIEKPWQRLCHNPEVAPLLPYMKRIIKIQLIEAILPHLSPPTSEELTQLLEKNNLFAFHFDMDNLTNPNTPVSVKALESSFKKLDDQSFELVNKFINIQNLIKDSTSNLIENRYTDMHRMIITTTDSSGNNEPISEYDGPTLGTI